MMLYRRPNLNDVDNTDISNSELKMEMIRITRLSIMKVTRTTCFVLLYYTDIAHTHSHKFFVCTGLLY